MANTTTDLSELTYQELKEVFETTFDKTANGISKAKIIEALKKAEETDETEPQENNTGQAQGTAPTKTKDKTGKLVATRNLNISGILVGEGKEIPKDTDKKLVEELLGKKYIAQK